MCNICEAALAVWSKDIDEGLTKEDFDALTSLANLVDLIPGSHSHRLRAGLTAAPTLEEADRAV
jgi:hypothetical protein